MFCIVPLFIQIAVFRHYLSIILELERHDIFRLPDCPFMFMSLMILLVVCVRGFDRVILPATEKKFPRLGQVLSPANLF